MTLPRLTVILLVGMTAFFSACSDDDGDATCEQACAITPLTCSAGPATLADCIHGCDTGLAGACGDEMQDLLNCSVDSTVTCDASGVPWASGCETEEDLYWTCQDTN